MIAILLLGIVALVVALTLRGSPEPVPGEEGPAETERTGADQRDQAQALFEDGEFESAIPLFKNYLESSPGDAEVRSDYAQALWLTGNKDGALEEFLATQEYSPDDASLSYRIGILLRQMERTDESIEWLEKTVALDDSTSVYYAELAKTYRMINDFPASLEAWTSAIELSPQEGRLAAALYAELGNTYRLANDDPAAKKAFQTGLESDPDNELLKQLIAVLE